MIEFNSNITEAPLNKELLIQIRTAVPEAEGITVGYFFSNDEGNVQSTVKGFDKSDVGYTAIGWKEIA